MPLKIDLHVHTRCSGDSTITLEDILEQIRRRSLDGVAITDHDTVDGAIETSRLISKSGANRPIIIPGVEVSTADGHIIGLNVAEPVPSGLSAEETVERIHESGGIAVAAHPQAAFKHGVGLGPRILSLGLDAIEVINSASFPFRLSVSSCRRFAEAYGLPQTAGSDSHIPEAIGLAYTLINSEDRSVDAVVESIRLGLATPVGRGMPLQLRVKSLLRVRGRAMALTL